MNIKNLSEAVLNDNSTNGIIYYFNGESYPYIQLNASEQQMHNMQILF